MPRRPTFKFLDSSMFRGRTVLATKRRGRRYGRNTSTIVTRFTDVKSQMRIRKRGSPFDFLYEDM